jgi:hypothetical protein
MLVPARNTSENTSAATALPRLVTFPPKGLLVPRGSALISYLLSDFAVYNRAEQVNHFDASP